LDSYIGDGRILVAIDGGEPIGYLQLVESEGVNEREVKSMAVAEDRQRQGIGRALMERVIAECRDDGVERLLVATAAADTGDLRFYQRLAFRMLRIDRDAFTPERGYPEGMTINGVPLRDRVWLELRP
jgi:GNAT superfamily N-acetyltransferase